MVSASTVAVIAFSGLGDLMAADCHTSAVKHMTRRQGSRWQPHWEYYGAIWLAISSKTMSHLMITCTCSYVLLTRPNSSGILSTSLSSEVCLWKPSVWGTTALQMRISVPRMKWHEWSKKNRDQLSDSIRRLSVRTLRTWTSLVWWQALLLVSHSFLIPLMRGRYLYTGPLVELRHIRYRRLWACGHVGIYKYSLCFLPRATRNCRSTFSPRLRSKSHQEWKVMQSFVYIVVAGRMAGQLSPTETPDWYLPGFWLVKHVYKTTIGELVRCWLSWILL